MLTFLGLRPHTKYPTPVTPTSCPSLCHRHKVRLSIVPATLLKPNRCSVGRSVTSLTLIPDCPGSHLKFLKRSTGTILIWHPPGICDRSSCWPLLLLPLPSLQNLLFPHAISGSCYPLAHLNPSDHLNGLKWTSTTSDNYREFNLRYIKT